MRTLRALWRLAGATVEALRGALICHLIFPRLDTAARRDHVRRWSQRTLARMGIGLHVEGELAPGPVLVAANHISWLDILAVDAVDPVRFVSKADVRRWPMLGTMIECGGTLFIERERKRDALRVVHQMAEALRAGDRVAVFPEGTTGSGAELLPFHANLLQAAIAVQAPVQPVALRFADAHRPFSTAVEYLGDTTLLHSVWMIACADALRIHVSFLPPVATEGAERRTLAEALRASIQSALDAGAVARR